ncbi:MAG TPA: acetyl-CoA carboxylase carboxyltransferase subunit alpha [Thermomicrobiales bacterium]|nr:acetyl-CoA carboxylase carboxyltransferase subunit alpha [Thermomicrobiales bacterium]
MASSTSSNGIGPWERVLLARHANRPHTLAYIGGLCDEFVELHGDRAAGDDAAIVGGIGRFRGRTVMLVGHQKGESTRENIQRNFGMPKPEGYRKALRLMQQAEKFGMPLISFIDTPGADPGLESEEHGQAFAIAANVFAMADLTIPTVALVIGEGGSGGALAIGVADRVLMLENAIYSVASPEACAAIIWKDAGRAPDAAAAMRVNAVDLLQFGLIDELVPENPAAHEDPQATITASGDAIERHLIELEETWKRGAAGERAMLEARYAKYRAMGEWHEAQAVPTPAGIGRR